MSEPTTTTPTSADPPQSHSTLKDFLASIATISGDLSNITAPPFVLDTKSVVELPAFWAERPSLFTAPAAPDDPAERALLVLRWFLASLRNQQYAGRAEDDPVKKPLNAFLGECFLAKWEDDSGITILVSEQVSHHPPVTACRVWNEEHGVFAEGFTRQEITLNLGSVAIKQTGHALLTLRSRGDETYLIPLPDVKLKGILSGLSGAYPELDGSYTIPCTSGYYSVVEFSGKSLLRSGSKNEFVARLHAPGRSEQDPLYTVTGNWNQSFTIYKGADTSESAATETLVLNDLPTVPLTLLQEDLDAQDPWESRRAWKGVHEALLKGDMSGTAKAKSVVEQGQRDMRKDEEASGKTWETLFFKPHNEDAVASSLYRSILRELNPEDTVAIWKFDEGLWKEGLKRPFHGNLTPDNKNGKEVATKLRNQHLIIGGISKHDDDDEIASPASFKTAHEFPLPTAPETNGALETMGTLETSGNLETNGALKMNGTSEPNGALEPTQEPLPPPQEPPPPPPPQQQEEQKEQKQEEEQGKQAPTMVAAKKAPAPRPVTPPRQSTNPPPSDKAATPSSAASISPSTRRGKRQRARESIGKFRSSISSGFSKLGSSPGPANGEAGS